MNLRTSIAAVLAVLGTQAAAAECPPPARGRVVELARASAVLDAPNAMRANIVGQLPDGACPRLRRRQGDWLEVVVPGGRIGWIHRDGVRRVVAARAAPGRLRVRKKGGAVARTAAARPAKTAERTAAARRAAARTPPPAPGRLDEDRRVGREATPRAAEPASAEAPPPAVPGGDVRVKVRSQSLLLEAPDDSARVVRVLQPGALLTFQETTADGAWVRVGDAGSGPRGWMARELLHGVPEPALPPPNEAPAQVGGGHPPRVAGRELAPSAHRGMVAAGVGYLSVWQEVRTDVEDPMQNYALWGLAGGGRVRTRVPLSARTALEARGAFGWVDGIEVDVRGRPVRLSAMVLDAEVGAGLRQPWSFASGWVGRWELEARLGYGLSLFAPRRTDPVIFTTHAFHGPRAVAGLRLPLPAVPATLTLGGGASANLARQWPETLGRTGLALGWLAEGGLAYRLGRRLDLDLRYEIAGRRARSTGGGSHHPDIAEARTREVAHGFTAGVALAF